MENLFELSDELRNSKFMIYALCDPDNGDVRYVGQTVQGIRRCWEHKSNAKNNRDTNTYKKNWINKLLKNNKMYCVMVLEKVTTKEELKPAEIKWIKYFKDLGFKLTNLTEGGDSNYTFTPEVIEKIRKSSTGRPGPNKGKRFSQEIRNKISTSLKGNQRTLGYKQKTESLIRMTIKQGKEVRPFYDNKGNKYTFLKEAQRATNINFITIQKMLKGLRLNNFRGYSFYYVDVKPNLNKD